MGNLAGFDGVEPTRLGILPCDESMSQKTWRYEWRSIPPQKSFTQTDHWIILLPFCGASRLGGARKRKGGRKIYWLVVWNIFYFSICWEYLGTIIPTDFHIFQRGWNHQYISICVFLQVGCVVLNGFSRASIQFLGNQVLDKHRLNLPAALVWTTRET